MQSANRPEADCGSDYELLIAKFRLKLSGEALQITEKREVKGKVKRKDISI